MQGSRLRQRLANLGEMGQAIGVIGVGLVRRHVERRLGGPRINAYRRQAFGAERMKEPDGQRAGSNTTRSGATACLRISAASNLGSEAHLPRHTRLPSRRTDTDVSFSETSSPIYSPMAVFHQMLGSGFPS